MYDQYLYRANLNTKCRSGKSSPSAKKIIPNAEISVAITAARRKMPRQNNVKNIYI